VLLLAYCVILHSLELCYFAHKIDEDCIIRDPGQNAKLVIDREHDMDSNSSAPAKVPLLIKSGH
jgi:hypothetical protein